MPKPPGESPESRFTVGYLAVHSLTYPRNERIRRALKRSGANVTTVVLAKGGSKYRRWITNLSAVWSTTRGRDVYVLAEFSSKFALIAWIWAKVNRAPLIVDGFVGIYETKIGDWQITNEQSLLARFYRLLDQLAVATASLYLIDTKLRAESVEKQFKRRLAVIALPVGAPVWTRSVAQRGAGGAGLSLLFYGNYLPLHGVEHIVSAVALLPSELNVTLKLIGTGERRQDTEEQASRLGMSNVCQFIDSVPESELASHISQCDIVLGVFGESTKAGSVTPNKVWQGLSSGRTVITRQTKSLDEIAGIAGSQLVTVKPGNPAELAAALKTVYEAGLHKVRYLHSWRDLEDYVEGQFSIFDESVRLIIKPV